MEIPWMLDDNDVPENVDGRQKITLYGCPSEGCLFTTGDPGKMSAHVNDEHEGEWEEDEWPTPDARF